MYLNFEKQYLLKYLFEILCYLEFSKEHIFVIMNKKMLFIF